MYTVPEQSEEEWKYLKSLCKRVHMLIRGPYVDDYSPTWVPLVTVNDIKLLYDKSSNHISLTDLTRYELRYALSDDTYRGLYYRKCTLEMHTILCSALEEKILSLI